MPAITVLCVDPDEPDGSLPVDGLSGEADVEVVERDSVASAKEALAERSVDCLVTEYDLPDGTGTELIDHVREVDPDTGCIICSDADRDEVAGAPERGRVAEFVRKSAPGASARIAQLVSSTAEHRSQTAYPLPADESERLAALAEYDLESERFRSAIGRVADVAAAHFDVTQSSVNLVTERRQEFLACHDEAWSATAREDSICTYAVLADGVTVVEDARVDPRFEGLETLDELGVRFYAGASVTTDEGYPVGTVCVYDETPRQFDGDDEAFLELLAAQATDLLELRRRRDAPDRDELTAGVGGGDDP